MRSAPASTFERTHSLLLARFWAYSLLGPQSSSYLGTGDHVARTIAANGLRLVLAEQPTTTTPRLKSGKPGKTKVVYRDPRARALERVTKGVLPASHVRLQRAFAAEARSRASVGERDKRARDTRAAPAGENRHWSRRT